MNTKGFAFVQYRHTVSAQNAIAAENGRAFFGQQIVVRANGSENALYQFVSQQSQTLSSMLFTSDTFTIRSFASIVSDPVHVLQLTTALPTIRSQRAM